RRLAASGDVRDGHVQVTARADHHRGSEYGGHSHARHGLGVRARRSTALPPRRNPGRTRSAGDAGRGVRRARGRTRRRQRPSAVERSEPAMIQALVDSALERKVLVLALGLMLFVWGIISFRALPVEAYPDVANNWVQIITQWPGRAGEEIEQQVTIPIEV